MSDPHVDPESPSSGGDGPRFTVIIPTYNRSGMLAETLQSVFDQEFTDYEILIVDDGSTDDTLESLAKLGDRVRVLQQQHKGCAAARNLGAREARGEYLAFLDDDDFWLPWTLAVFAEAITRFDQPTFVAGNLTSFHDPDEVRQKQRDEPVFGGGPDYFAGALEHGFALGVAHGVVRRDAYLAVGGCEERDINATDSDVLLKLGDLPGFAIVKQPVTLAYRQHTGSTTRNYDKGLAGMRMLLEQDRRGAYPGGDERRPERMANILSRTRGVCVGSSRRGRPDVAWRLYRETFAWNLRLGRFRFLLAMPLLIAQGWAMKLLGR
ncbi:MAG: glycosyltransferase family A protein [Planctomycetota bacterium]